MSKGYKIGDIVLVEIWNYLSDCLGHRFIGTISHINPKEEPWLQINVRVRIDLYPYNKPGLKGLEMAVNYPEITKIKNDKYLKLLYE